MAYTLPVNKFLGALANTLISIREAPIHDGTGVDRLLSFARSDDIEVGGVRAIISADLPSVEDYSDTMSLTEVKKPVVNEQFIDATEYKVIRLTLNRYMTKEAMLSESNLSTFSAYILATMKEARDNFLYKELIKTLKAYAPTKATQIVSLTLTDISKLTTHAEKQFASTENAKLISETLINKIVELSAPTTKYNDLGYEENIDPSKMGLIISSQYDTKMLHDVFASLYNSDLIKDGYKWGETIKLPSEQLDDDTLICWLIQKEKLIYGFKYNLMTEFFNPANLNQTNYLHFAYYMGIDNARACIKITKKA